MANILCVDDDPIILTHLQNILSDTHRCLICRSGGDALELLEHELPDLILLDIMLEDIDGFEVMKKIRDKYPTADIPIIFITSDVNEIREKEAFAIEAADFIRKPINPVRLLTRVDNQLKLLEAKEALVNKEKYAIYRAMAQSTQHILNNFLNQMLLFELTSNEIEDFPEDIKVLIKSVIQETSLKVDQLSNIEDVSVEKIHSTVFSR